MTRLNNIIRNPQGFNQFSLTLRRQYSSLESIYATPLSTVHRGNAFEERSLKLLEQTMSMSLKRVGGKEDGGIDLVGWWWLPELSSNASQPCSNSPGRRRRIRVIGQCKAEKKKLGPNHVRELEGVVYRFLNAPTIKTESLLPIDTSPSSLVALLISQSAFTKSTILHAQSSPIPFFLLHLPPPTDAFLDSENSPGRLGSALCNPALFGAQGLLKGHMDVRWERHHLGDGGRPALWWRNEKMDSQIPDSESSDATSDTP